MWQGPLPFLILKKRIFTNLPSVIFYCDHHSEFFASFKERRGYLKSMDPVIHVLPLKNCTSPQRRYYKLECHLSFAKEHAEGLSTRADLKTVFEKSQILNILGLRSLLQLSNSADVAESSIDNT